MNYNEINFPYPVLKKGDDSISSHIDFKEPVITEDQNNYQIKIEFIIENFDILQLINNNKAEYFVEIICSDTFFRKVYKTTNNIIEFKIPKTSLKGKVTGNCLVIAKEDINKYQNSQAHSDYDEFTINIKQGDILAYFGEFSFTAHINYKKLKAVASFMEVIEGDEDITSFDLEGNKILIKLPKQDYKIFKQDIISKEQKLVPIIHSSIVFNALLIALYNIEEYSDKLWAQAIFYRMKNDNELEIMIGKDDNQFDKEKIPEIAQVLLGNPINRLMKQLDENLIQEDEY